MRNGRGEADLGAQRRDHEGEANAPKSVRTWLSERRRPHGQRLLPPSHSPCRRTARYHRANGALSPRGARTVGERTARLW